MQLKTRDLDIRKALHFSDEIVELRDEDPRALVIDEFSICQGQKRIDLAVINGAFHGYEIKSDMDTLDRLPAQADEYNKVADYITIVVGERYLERINALVPYFWGIAMAKKTDRENVDISFVRAPQENVLQDSYAIAQLLWKEEALDLFDDERLRKKYKNKPRRDAWEWLSLAYNLRELKAFVREKLKSRPGWRQFSR